MFVIFIETTLTNDGTITIESEVPLFTMSIFIIIFLVNVI